MAAHATSADQARLPWLIAAMGMATLPFASDLPPWEVLGVAGCAWGRMARERRGLGAVPRLVRLAILVLVVIALWFSGALGVGLALGTPMVVGFCWLKLLEMKGARDYALCCFLSLFLVAVLLFDQQSLLSCAYSLATVAVILAALARLQVSGAAATVLALRASTRRLILHALPLALLVFVLTPRLQLDLPNVTGQGVSGFTDRMRPGDIARLATSDKVVFRVEFPDGQLPNGIELYWRGLVMNSSQDGSLWRVEDAYGGVTRGKGPWAGGLDLPTLAQDITLMPDGQRWLFGLEAPLALSADAGARGDNGTLRHGQPVNHVLSYRVTSRLGDRAMDNDPAASARFRLMDQDVVALAERLKAGTASADQAAARVLRYFAEQGFTYSLNPGAMGEDSLKRFLFTAKVGFCAHYATAFASLMRLMGYPARVVIGYHGGEVNPVGDFVVVRQLHAHAWAEVRQKDGDWKHYDPTSGLPVAPGEELSIAQRPGAAALSMTLDRTPAWLPGWLRAPWEATRQWLGWAEARWDGWFMGFDGERQALLMAALGSASSARSGCARSSCCARWCCCSRCGACSAGAVARQPTRWRRSTCAGAAGSRAAGWCARRGRGRSTSRRAPPRPGRRTRPSSARRARSMPACATAPAATSARRCAASASSPPACRGAPRRGRPRPRPAPRPGAPRRLTRR